MSRVISLIEVYGKKLIIGKTFFAEKSITRMIKGYAN